MKSFVEIMKEQGFMLEALENFDFSYFVWNEKQQFVFSVLVPNKTLFREFDFLYPNLLLKTDFMQVGRHIFHGGSAWSAHKELYCPHCGGRKPFTNKFCCHKCATSSSLWRESFEQTMLERHGVTNPYFIDGVVEQMARTCLKRHGVENIFQDVDRIKAAVQDKYGVEYTTQLPEVQEKIKQTNLERYGVENVLQTNSPLRHVMEESIRNRFGGMGAASSTIRSKMEQTCIDRYGVHNILCSDSPFKSVIEDLLIEKYGTKYVLQNPEILERSRQSSLEKYGVSSYTQTQEFKDYMSTVMASEEVQSKMKQTNLERYGVEHVLQDTDILDTKIETQRENGTFSTSKDEEFLFEKLSFIWPNVERQYKDAERYPWRCDFYVPELDLFIEYQGSWTHGFRPFDKDDLNCQAQLAEWVLKSENSSYYQIAVYVWTDLDVRKRQFAQDHNLNWIEFFTVADFEDWLSSLLPNTDSHYTIIEDRIQ